MSRNLFIRVCTAQVRLYGIVIAVSLLPLLVLLLLPHPAAADAPVTADPTYRWHTFYGTYADDTVSDMVRDSSGNLYLAGASDGPWTGPNGEMPLHAYGGTTDIVVVKLDPSGNYLWHTFYGWAGTEIGYGIALDPNGNVYVSGVSEESWLGDNAKSPLHNYMAQEDLFVLKLDANGGYLWHTFYGSSGIDLQGDITIDSDGIYISGAGVNWKGPKGELPLHAHRDGLTMDLFVLHLDSSGNYQWHTFYPANTSEEETALYAANGFVYLAGRSGIAWNGPAGQLPLHPYTASYDILLLKLTRAGAYQWHTFYGGPDGDTASGVAMDETGNIYLAGSSTSTWKGAQGQLPLHAHSGSSDLFVLKLNRNGSYAWHTFYGSSKQDNGEDLKANANGVFVTGSSYATWNGPGGQPPLHPFTGNDAGDILALKLDNAGTYQWHTFYGSTEGYMLAEKGVAVATDNRGSFYIAGPSAASWTGPNGELPLNRYASPRDMTVLKLQESIMPALYTLNPASIPAGSAGFTLAVTGARFATNSVIRWNGNNIATTYVNSRKLTASIPASFIARAGSATITVFSPMAGSGESNARTLSIAEPAIKADLSIIKGVRPAQIANTLVYTLTVSNAGPSPAASIVVSDTLPSQVEFISSSAGTGTCAYAATIRAVKCKLGTLAVNTTWRITVRVKWTGGAGDTVTNCAGVKSATYDTDLKNNRRCVTHGATALTPGAQMVSGRADKFPDISLPNFDTSE